MSHSYTSVYRVSAVSVSQAQLAAAIAAIPRDTDMEAELGLSLVSDVTTTAGPNVVERTIILTDALAVPSTLIIPSGQPLAAMLTGWYTATFGTLLTTPVTPFPVVVT